ncbi:MarR family winged helix-turn-helix transcriptional regulator [Novosphingobium arvoryzae]|uniref:MarR family transcriptional regulator n=1 Tax=Novosphingobium arvoryzae TaxID=1256514 RepID=A0A918RGT2_9SPHN|nr:MarR family winged helix-turn-helix transcriptional regulator [Novosphingobium arvoryzae]GGZ98477.1 MarR family transcriptional regulator [Novosphingobium arvoryzae]
MPARSSRLSDFLPYLMSVTTNAVSDLVAGKYRERFGLKIPEWRVMAVLGDAGALTQRDLVGATRMDKVAVNRACKVLEDRGLAARSPNDRDGRSHHLELTAAGKAMHAEIMPLALGMEKQLFAVLSAQERRDFKAVLARINDQVHKLESMTPGKKDD